MRNATGKYDSMHKQRAARIPGTDHARGVGQRADADRWCTGLDVALAESKLREQLNECPGARTCQPVVVTVVQQER